MTGSPFPKVSMVFSPCFSGAYEVDFHPASHLCRSECPDDRVSGPNKIGCPRNLRSLVRINGLLHLLIPYSHAFPNQACLSVKKILLKVKPVKFQPNSWKISSNILRSWENLAQCFRNVGYPHVFTRHPCVLKRLRDTQHKKHSQNRDWLHFVHSNRKSPYLRIFHTFYQHGFSRNEIKWRIPSYFF